ncbi:MAG: anti-sigma factor [Microvirga sp.]
MTEPEMERAEWERLAAEHVMGLLEGDERARAEGLLAADASFAALVETWQNRFQELDDLTQDVPAGETLWARIEAGLPSGTSATPARSRVTAPVRTSAFATLWRSLPFWRGAGLAGALASLLLLVGVGVFAQRAARQPVLIAVLLNDANRPSAVVNAFANGNAELVPLDGIPIPPGRSLEIWTLWDQARGPVSIGVIDAARTVRLKLDDLPRTAPNQLFEVSLEPAGGSPTGLPTGPVLMKGTASNAL